MLPGEWTETFQIGLNVEQGIFTEWDEDQKRTESGMIVSKVTLLITDEVSQRLDPSFVKIRRNLDGQDYLIKERRRTGVGLTELRLERPYEGQSSDIGTGRF